VVGNPGLVEVPVSTSIGDPDNSIADAFALCTADANCSPVSQNLATFLPFNPGPDIGLNLDLNNRNREDNGILKLDYHLSEKSNLVATYFLGTAYDRRRYDGGECAVSLSSRRPGPRSSAEAGSGHPLRGSPTNSGWVTTGLAAGRAGDHNSDPATTYGLNTGVPIPPTSACRRFVWRVYPTHSGWKSIVAVVYHPQPHSAVYR